MRYSRRASGLYAAQAERPRGARGFMPAFGAPIAAPIATPGGVVGPATLILDEFTDTDSTLLADHTIAPTNVPSATWVHAGAQGQDPGVGEPDIQSNKARLTDDRSVAYVETGKGDVTLTATVNFTGCRAGFTLRWVNVYSHWLVYYDYYGGSKIFILVEVYGMGETVKATSAGLTFTDPATLKVVALGSTITAFWNGLQACQCTDATYNQTETKHGLFNVVGSDPTFDDFTVTNP